MKYIKTVEEFDSLVSGEKPVLVDFYADWCGPCKMMEPTLESMDKKYNGLIEVSKVNVENLNEISARFDVTSIPTLVFLKNKEVIHKETGAMSAAKLSNSVEQNFGITAAMLHPTN